MADFIITLSGPEGPTEQIVSDATEDGRALIRMHQGSGRVRPVDSESRQRIGREQYIQDQGEALDRQGLAGEAIRLGAGVVDEATFGLYERHQDPLEQLRGEAVRRDGGGFYIAGRALPAALAALATGGESAVLRGAGSLTQGGLSQLAGSAVERLILSGAAEAGLARRAAGYTAGALTDAAVGGLGQTITDANIQGTALDGEMLAANIGIGIPLALGGVGLRTLGELPSVRRTPAPEEVLALNEVGLGPHAEPSVGIGPRQQLPESQAAIAQFLTDPRLSILSGLDDAGQRQARQLFEFGIERADDSEGFIQHSRETSAIGDEGVQLSREAAQPLSRLEDRQAALFGDMSDVPPEAVSGAQDALRTLRDRLPRVGGRDLAEGDLRAIRGLQELYDRVLPEGAPGTRQVFDPSQPSGYRTETIPAAAFDTLAPEVLAARLDEFLQDARSRGIFEEAGLRDPDVIEAVRLAMGTPTQVEAGTIRGALGRLGQGGAAAAEIHGALDNAARSSRDIARLGGRSARTGDFEFNQGRMFAATADSIYRVADDQNARIDRFTRDMRALNDLRDRFVGDGAGSQANARLDAFDSRMREGQAWGTATATYRGLQAKMVNSAGLRSALGQAGILGGGMAAGPLGVAAGLGAVALQHPLHAMRLWQKVGGAVGRSDVRMTDGIGRLRSVLEGGRVASQVARRLRAGFVSQRLLSGARSEEQREEAYRDVVGQLRAYQANPMLLADQVEYAVGDVGHYLPPAVGGAVSMSMVNAVSYLTSVLPPADIPDPFGNVAADRPPSATEMRSFLRRVEAADDPLILIDLAMMKQLSSDHVEAVRAIYPQVLTEIQSRVLEMMAGLKSRPPHSLRAQVNILLEQTVPDMAPAMVFHLQQSFSQTSQQLSVTRSGTRRDRAGQNTFTSSQRIEGRF